MRPTLIPVYKSLLAIRAINIMSTNVPLEDDALVAGLATLDIPAAVEKYLNSKQVVEGKTKVKTRIAAVLLIICLLLNIIDLIVDLQKDADGTNTAGITRRFLRTVAENANVLTGALWSGVNQTISRPA